MRGSSRTRNTVGGRRELGNYTFPPLGMLSAAASQGLVLRWDIDTGLTRCDRFLYVTEDYIKVR